MTIFGVRRLDAAFFLGNRRDPATDRKRRHGAALQKKPAPCLVRWAQAVTGGYRRCFGEEIVAIVPARGYAQPLESQPSPRAEFIGARPAYSCPGHMGEPGSDLVAGARPCMLPFMAVARMTILHGALLPQKGRRHHADLRVPDR
jgi:hypothetical protein